MTLLTSLARIHKHSHSRLTLGRAATLRIPTLVMPCQELVTPALVGLVLLGTALQGFLPRSPSVLDSFDPAVPRMASTNDFAVIAQVSDIHTSETSYLQGLRFERFATDVLAVVNPDGLVVSGDLVDNKYQLFDSRPRGFIDSEWNAYSMVMNRSKEALPEMAVLDQVGNHGRFGHGLVRAGRIHQTADSRGTVDPFQRYSARTFLRKSSPPLERSKRHELVTFHSPSHHVSVDLIAIDATVNPAPTRHFFGYLSHADLQEIHQLLSRPSEATVRFSTCHYPYTAISQAQSPAQLSDLYASGRIRVAMSGHLHQLHLGGRVSMGGRLHGRPLHGVLRSKAFPGETLELEVSDFRVHGRYRVFVVEEDGRVGFVEPLTSWRAPRRLGGGSLDLDMHAFAGYCLFAPRAEGCDHVPLRGLDTESWEDTEEFPFAVITSPTDARYLTKHQAAAAIDPESGDWLVTAVAFSPEPLDRASVQLELPGASVTREVAFTTEASIEPIAERRAQTLSSRKVTHYRIRATIPASIVRSVMDKSQPRSPTLLEAIGLFRMEQVNGASARSDGTEPSDTMVETAAPGFPFLTLQLSDVRGVRKAMSIPVSPGGQRAPLPWQQFITGSMRGTIELAAGRAFGALVLVFLLPLVARAGNLWESVSSGQMIHERVLSWAIAPIDSLWRRFPWIATLILLWLFNLVAGPWTVGELLPGKPWTILFFWGHIFVASSADCSPEGIAEGCFPLTPSWLMPSSLLPAHPLLIGWVRHLDGGIYIAQLLALVIAPSLAILGMASLTMERDEQRLFGRSGGPPTWKTVLLEALFGRVGATSRPGSIVGLVLLLALLFGGYAAMATLSTHHGITAAAASIGLGWPCIVLGASCAWIVLRDLWRQARLVLTLCFVKPHAE
jgi:hypothetical protein